MDTISTIYEKATGQSLRPQDMRLVHLFAGELLRNCGNEVMETINHSDVDDHSFEDGKENIARHMLAMAEFFSNYNG
jgi:hypothetical protein